MVDSQNIEGVRLLIKHKVNLDVINHNYSFGCPLLLAVDYGLYNSNY